jgi:hypothetical protein
MYKASFLQPSLKVVLVCSIFSLLVACGNLNSSTGSSKATSQSSPTGLATLYKTGSQVIPTVAVSTSTANCVSKNIPGVDQYPAHVTGSKAITPHLCSIPTFTEQDVRKFMSTITTFQGMRINQDSATYRITRILFITNAVANDPNGLNADTGQIDPNLIVCYVEVYGDFSVGGGPPMPSNSTPKTPTELHHGQLVFDGITGNELDMGVMQ